MSNNAHEQPQHTDSSMTNLEKFKLLMMINGLILILFGSIESDRSKRIGRIIVGLSSILISLFLPTFSKTEKEKIPNKDIGTVLTTKDLTNGIYYSLGVYRNSDEKWLVILHPTIITKVDTKNQIIESVKVGDYPILVSIDMPISSPQTRFGTNLFTGFAEVISYEGGKKAVRDYNPFTPPLEN